MIRFDDPEGIVLAEHGDVNGEHVKVVHGGTLVQGSPVGVDEHRVTQLCKVVAAKIGATGTALNSAPSLQVSSFLGQQCAGAQPVQHAMRSQARRIWEAKPTGGGQSAIEMAESLSLVEMQRMVEGRACPRGCSSKCHWLSEWGVLVLVQLRSFRMRRCWGAGRRLIAVRFRWATWTGNGKKRIGVKVSGRRLKMCGRHGDG